MKHLDIGEGVRRDASIYEIDISLCFGVYTLLAISSVANEKYGLIPL